MKFTKMQGLGNDYVYVSLFDQTAPRDPAKLAVAISDRHFGVGSDGLILIGPSERADARMRMFNADGSESEMCGNGIRCVAKFLFDHGIAPRKTVTVETGRGVLTLEIEAEKAKAKSVRVDMGPPILDAERIPATLPGPRIVDLPLPATNLRELQNLRDFGIDPRLTCVSMGNPHVVLFCENVEAVPLELIGPALETAPWFPKRINVHLAQVRSPNEVSMRTWERGSGITLACGTGACSVCVAGVLTGRTQRAILAHLPGGDLHLEWPNDTASVFMTGPAVEVFEGEWPTTMTS
jgi:diaminopimelate epimerase